MRRRRSRNGIRVGPWAAAGGIAAGAALLGSLAGSLTVSAMDPHYRYAAEARAERERFRAFRMPEPTRPAEAAYSPIPRWDEWAGPPDVGAVMRKDPYDDPALLGPERDWEAESRRYAEEARAEVQAIQEQVAREETRRAAEVAMGTPTVAVPTPPIPVVGVGPVEPVPTRTVRPLR